MTLYKNNIRPLALPKSFKLLLLSLILVGCSDHKEKANDHISKTADYINKGELEKARIELKASSQSGKDTAETYYYMALLNEKKKAIKGNERKLT